MINFTKNAHYNDKKLPPHIIIKIFQAKPKFLKPLKHILSASIPSKTTTHRLLLELSQNDESPESIVRQHRKRHRSRACRRHWVVHTLSLSHSCTRVYIRYIVNLSRYCRCGSSRCSARAIKVLPPPGPTVRHPRGQGNKSSITLLTSLACIYLLASCTRASEDRRSRRCGSSIFHFHPRRFYYQEKRFFLSV